MRKNIVFISLVAVFLLLMIPSVNSIEYQQVENHIKYKIDQININIDVNELRTLNRLPRIEEIRNILNKIADTQDDICLSCTEDLSADSDCTFLLFIFTLIILHAWVYIISIVGIPIGLLQLAKANEVYNEAKALGCPWTGG